jgi:transposase-like protein
MGATAEGKKELIAIADGYRESEQSWKELLLDVKARGLDVEPSLAIGDGALGFWKAMRQVWDTTKEQRCWVHTIRAQSIPGRLVTRSSRRRAAERDHVADLQRPLSHDHALDQQLQDLLLLCQRRPVQPGEDPVAERRQVRQHRPGARRLLA